MAMHPLAVVILTAVLLESGLRLVADVLNLRALEAGVPGELRELVDAAGYERYRAYQHARTGLQWAAEGIHLGALLLVWLAGGLAWLDAALRGLGWSPVPTGLAYIAVLAAGRSLLGLPLALYATFVIEARFGFNRTDGRTFAGDRVKALVLAVLLGGPLLALVLWLFEAAAAHAWWISWMTVTLAMLVVQYVAPTWIMPWFNRFAPLEDRDLERAVREYAGAIDFPVRQVRVMDASRRSAKANAFFTGFGRQRRIVLFDTLVGQLSPEEVLAVVAHEMGHHKLGHIPRSLALGVAQAGLLFYLLNQCIGWEPLFRAFYLEHASVYGGLVLFGVLLAPVNLAAGVAFQALSRRFEFAADRFAVQTTGRGTALASALKALAVSHLAHLTPHPLHVWLNDSHPPLLARVRAIRELPGSA
jgi:STE24 endopeptidase